MSKLFILLSFCLSFALLGAEKDSGSSEIIQPINKGELLPNYQSYILANESDQGGTYVFLRTANTPKTANIEITKRTNLIETTTANSWEKNPWTGKPTYQSIELATDVVKLRKTLTFDFSKSKELTDDEVEKIVLVLDLNDTRIKIKEVEVADTDRYTVKKEINWFNPSVGTVNFAISQ